MGQVPTTNINALYSNTTDGITASPTIMDSAVQDIVATINTNDTAFGVLSAAGGIGTTNLANLAVTTTKIALLAVTAAQIANATITAAQLADSSITSAKILDGAIVDADINAAAAIAWAKISKVASSLADLATRSATDLTSGTLNVARLPTGIDVANLANGLVSNIEFQYLDGVTSALQTQLDAKIPLTQKGAASGVVPLNASSKIDTTYIPDSVLGQLEYQGTWDASSNTPTLATASTVKGYYYVVSVTGTQFSLSFDIGDWVVSNGTIWQKVDNTDAVASVFGRTGAIVAATNDYTWAQINKATSSLLDITTRSASDLNAGTLPVGRVPTGIPATSISSGAVDNTHFDYLADVTSLIQAQLNAKAPLTHVGTGGSSQHPDATTSQSGFISAADLIAFRALSPTGLGTYAIPLAQILSFWSRYSIEQDSTLGELIFYEI